jgi:hypothetical protein
MKSDHWDFFNCGKPSFKMGEDVASEWGGIKVRIFSSNTKHH